MTFSIIDRTTEHAKRVVSGEFVAGHHVRNACQRHLDDLKNGHERGLRFDLAAANKAFRFFEEKLKLSEGQFEGKNFQLHEVQDFIIGSLFGWLRADDTRRFRRGYIEQGKGNGKSPLAGGIGLFGLTADKEPGAQIYAAAAKKDQADILFRDAIKMRSQSPDIKKRTSTSGGPGREYNLANLSQGSFFRPISRDAGKTGSGPRPHFALCDEVHEHPDRGIMEMLERGFKFRRQPLLLMITNSGSDRNSVCWEEHEHAVRVASGNVDAKDDDASYIGEVIDDTTFSYVCALDPKDDPLNDPTCWIKANPLLGVTITEEYLAGVVAQARAMPGKLNGILRLHFCKWTDSETAWMTREALEPAIIELNPKDYLGRKAWCGLDLSDTKDFTALATVVEDGFVEDGDFTGKPKYAAWVHCWTPKDTLQARDLEDKMNGNYQLWVDNGWVTATQGNRINYRNVAQALADVNYDYDLQCAAYDRYAFKSKFEPEIEDMGLSVDCVEHPQGGTKKGKPSDAMKEVAKKVKKDPEGLWMPSSIQSVEELISQGRIKIQNSPATISAIMSSATDEDRWGNYWISKQISSRRIDAAVALAMAVGAATAYEGTVPGTPWDNDPEYRLEL